MKKKIIKKYFTKEEIKKVLTLWNEKTTEDLAQELGRSKASIHYIAQIIRKAGYKLPRKKKVGTTNSMVREVLEEEDLMGL